MQTWFSQKGLSSALHSPCTIHALHSPVPVSQTCRLSGQSVSLTHDLQTPPSQTALSAGQSLLVPHTTITILFEFVYPKTFDTPIYSNTIWYFYINILPCGPSITVYWVISLSLQSPLGNSWSPASSSHFWISVSSLNWILHRFPVILTDVTRTTNAFKLYARVLKFWRLI